MAAAPSQPVATAPGTAPGELGLRRPPAGAALLRDRLMQRSWQKPLAAMSWSWLPTSTTRPSARATMMGGAHGPSSADALHQEANDYYRAARRSTRRR